MKVDTNSTRRVAFWALAGVIAFSLTLQNGNAQGSIDNFSNAEVVASLPFSGSADTSQYTIENTDPIPSCVGDRREKSAWYSFTPTDDVTLVADTFNTTYDTTLSVYTGSLGSFGEIACNDDAGEGFQSRVSFQAAAGTNYFFMISAYDGDGGTLHFHLTARPANDNFSSALVIGATPFSNSVSTAEATIEDTDPFPTCGDGHRAKSVWYRFTPTLNGTITADTFGTSYDTILSVYTGSLSAFVQTACNDDTGGIQSQVSFQPTAGTEYFFMISAYDGDGGPLTFNFHFVIAPPANDNFSNALEIGSGPFMSSVDSTAATTEDLDPTPGCANGSRAKSVWYRFTPSVNETVMADTFASNYDTILSAYTGSPFAFVQVACNTSGPYSQVSFQATAGITYFFMVTSVNSNGGTISAFHLNISILKKRGGQITSQ